MIQQGGNEMKQLNRKVLMNDTYMNFPSEFDQNSYTCCMFMLTYNCGFSKKFEKYTCSNSNPTNAGKDYFACQDRCTRNEIGKLGTILFKKIQLVPEDIRNIYTCCSE